MYRPYETSPEQDATLDAIEGAVRRGAAALLDLDGCLFDTRHRQVQIFRAWAEETGDYAVARVTAEHFVDRSFARTLERAGVPPERARALERPLRSFWSARFFDAEHLLCDLPLPGAVRLVRRIAEAGGRPLYLTGRHAGMRQGTVHMLARFGFPAGELWTKPDPDLSDEAWKARALDDVGDVCLGLDNEPANVNTYADRCPGALVVLVETDAGSAGPRPHLPRIRGFLRTTD